MSEVYNFVARTRGDFVKRFLTLLACTFLVACGSDTSTPANLSGSWHATVTSMASGPSVADMFIRQNGTSISSPLVVLGNTTCAPNGTMSGTVHGSAVSLTIIESDFPADVITMSGSLTNGVVSGSYTTMGSCTNGDRGTFSAALIPAVASSAWTGSTNSGSGGAATTFTGSLSEDSTGALSGMLVFTGSPCLSSVNVSGSQVGDLIGLSDGNLLIDMFGMTNPNGKSIAGNYSLGAACSLDSGTFTMGRP